MAHSLKIAPARYLYLGTVYIHIWLIKLSMTD